MSFRIPQSLLAGGIAISETFTTDTLIGDLFTYLGGPATARDIVLVADGADIGNIIITLDFPPGTTFTISAINGGRILGLGGDGGDGGDDLGSTGTAGYNGSDGGAAITSAFDVSLDIDDGYLLGGGGGGGGGAYTDTGAGGDAGGGGGGGQGFSTTSGGDGGASIGLPPGIDGTDGGQTGQGTGGTGGGSTLAAGAGGDGGIWGAGGHSGRSSDMIQTGVSSFYYHGGVGGRGGSGFVSTGGELSFDGAKTEATLRSEGRIKGETADIQVNLPTAIGHNVSVSGESTTGILFKTDGDFEKVESVGGNTAFTVYWADGTETGFGDEYDVRLRGLSGDSEGTWDVGTVAGTWVTLTSNRTWAIVSSASIESAAGLFEIRRNDLPAGSSDDEIIDSFLVLVTDENGV